MNSKIYLIILSVVPVLLLVKIIAVWPDGNLRYIHCDVGQGDAIVISRKTSQLLIDAGKGSAVVECLEQQLPFWDKILEVVVVTHSDSDHYGGLAEILNRYQIKLIILPSGKGGEEEWNALLEKIEEKGIKTSYVWQLEKVEIDLISATFLWPNEEILIDKDIFENTSNNHSKSTSANYSDNDASIVTKVTFGDFSALLTGDVTEAVEQVLLENSSNLRSTVLKVGHHGSRFSTSAKFLYEVEPTIATIGVGKNNYGHPAEEVIERLSHQNASVYRTDIDGTIVIVSNGQKWWKQ